MISRKGILFVISGPSGVGKGTVRSGVLSIVDNLQVSVSATTRKPRAGEMDRREYFFVDKARFQQMIELNLMLEWAVVYGNMYGTPREFVMSTLQSGRDVLLEIDIQGAMQVKKTMPEGVFIFISPPSLEELDRRLCRRGKDSDESIEMRRAACEQEMAHMHYYNYIVVNDSVDDAVDKVRSIIIAERCRINNLKLG